jgi:hypothetical protein
MGGPSPARCSIGFSSRARSANFGIVLEEDQADRPYRAVAVLGEDQLGSAGILGVSWL